MSRARAVRRAKSLLRLASESFPSPPVQLAVSACAWFGLLLFPLAVYRPFLGDFFALDDYMWLQAASNPNALDYFKDAFSFPHGTLFDAPTPFWRPLVDTYFFAAWRLFELQAGPYHVANVLMHGAVASLGAALVWQVTSSRLTGLLAGLLFAALPTYDFAVSWISSATELLGTLFYLLTLVLFAAYLRGPRSAAPLYWGALAALFCALLSKESTVTLPAALAGVAVAVDPPRSRQDIARRAGQLVPFAALTLAYFVFVYVREYRPGGDDSAYRFGWHALENIWDYLKWMTLPVPDSYAPWVARARPFAAATFLVLGCLATALRRPLLALSFAWTLVALLPYSFFRAGIEYRYTYLASVPFAIFVTLLLAAGATRLARPTGSYVAMAGLSVAVVAASAFLTGQTRDRQEFMATQGRAYGEFFHQAPDLCGELPREGIIYVLSSPMADLFGVSTRMAMNMRYQDVHVGLVPFGQPLPELAAFAENKCVIEYAGAGYVKVPSE